MRVNEWLWLAGFIDGDGTLQVKIKKDKKGYNYKSPKIAIAQKRRENLDYIKKIIGFGSIYFSKGAKVFYYEVYGIKRVNYILEKIKNDLHSIKKKNQLKKMIEYKIINSIKENKINKYWLAGFYEAEGYASKYKHYYKNKIYIYHKIGFCQNDDKELLLKIQKYFGFGTIDKRNIYFYKDEYIKFISNLIYKFIICRYKYNQLYACM